MHSGNGFDFAKIGIHPKSRVSQPGDEFEQEADRVAEQVMRMSAPSRTTPTVSNKEEVIHRKCGACEMKEKEKQNLQITRRTSTSSKIEASDEVAARSQITGVKEETNEFLFWNHRVGDADCQ